MLPDQSSSQSADRSLDLVTLVDRAGQKIGEMDKIEAHLGKGQLHLACSVFLFRHSIETGRVELLIQQRSPLKIVGQRQWANTICGNVRPTETPEECAHRRLREELGIVATELVPLQTFYYQAVCNSEFSEHEFDHVFAGWYDGPVVPNPSEATAAQWVTLPEQVEEGDQDQRRAWLAERDFAPWFRLMLLDAQIWQHIYQFVHKVS